MSDEKKAIKPVDRMMMFVAAEQQRIERIMPEGAGLKLDRLMTQVRLAIQKQPSIAECTPQSVVNAVLTAAELGLDPSGRLGSGWLIPYKAECQFIPGYRGLIDLAVRSGEVKQVRADVVFWGDEFDYELGDRPRLHHKPNKPNTPEEMKAFKAPTADDVRAAYAVATLSDGSKQFVVMERWELDRIKARSPGARSGKSPWNDNVDRIEMYRKCPVRKLCKNLALSPEKARLLGLALEKDPDEPGSEGERELNQIVPQEGESADVKEQKKPSKADSLKGKLGTDDAEWVALCGAASASGTRCVLAKGHREADDSAHEDGKGLLW